MEVGSVYQIYGFQMKTLVPISGFQQDSIKKWLYAFAFIPEIPKTLLLFYLLILYRLKAVYTWGNNLCWLAFSQKQLLIQVTKTMNVHSWIYNNSYLQD